VQTALLVAGGYLLGSVPWGLVVVRLLRGEDIRSHGSGNVGASNVWRTYGWRLGLPVAVLDVAKGFVPALAAVLLVGEGAGVLAGAAAMLGHYRPLYLGFSKGGKMVATAGGVAFALMPVAAAGCVLIWVAAFALLRYASIASLLAAVGLPVLAAVLGEPWPTIVFASVACAAVVVLHRQNIRRLLAGTEPRFSRAAKA
jgi:glycerol-3-phosphate acyltransferase PlsY